MNFEESNKKTLQIIETINNYLKNTGWFYITPIINIMHFYQQKNNKTIDIDNNNIIVDEAGYGKSTFLKKLLLPSLGPKKIVLLPRKMYASELGKQKKEYYHKKVCIHDDLIFAFKGLTTKQREQLGSFWTSILDDGTWEQAKQKITGIDCIAMFGMAKEAYFKNLSELQENTFFERFISIIQKFRNNKERAEILEKIDYNIENKIPPPKIELNFKKTNINQQINQEIKKTIRKTGLEMEARKIISATRAMKYIRKFCIGNAYLNEREEVNTHDLELFEKVYHYHIGSQSSINKIKKLMEENKKDNEIIEELNISRATYYRHKKIIKNLQELR